MRYGRLDRRIAIQRRTVTLSASGQENETWATIATVWASVAPARGDERFTAPQIGAKEVVEIEVRHSSRVAGIHPRDRVVFPSSSGLSTAVYDILAVHEIGRRIGLKLIAERRPDLVEPDAFDAWGGSWGASWGNAWGTIS